MLMKYEFLKILRRKSTFIVMTASLLITAFLFGLPVMQYQTYNQDGVIKGFQGIAYAKEQYRDQSVTLTDEYITETIRAYQHLFENSHNIGYDGNEQFLVGDAYWDFVAPREKLLRMTASTYDNPGESSGLQKLPSLDLTNGSNFYQARTEKIEKLLDTPWRNLSDSQKEYWENKISNVKTPLQYGYYEGWEIIISSFELLMFALLAVCIVIAPVFSGEYQAGTDAVIFIPIFLTPSGTTGAYNLILFLLPYRSAMPELGKYISYQFGGVVLNVLSVRALLYVLLTFVMIPFAKLGFRKHQVSV